MLYAASGTSLTTVDLYDLLRLRVDVFVVEQECPYPELDGRDLLESTIHLWWRPETEVLGCLRLLDEGDVVRVGRVCTAASARGTGVGAKLMAAAVDRIGDRESVLGAQVQAQGLYARFGYTPEGESYLEDGIPHIAMRRRR
ncbi:GNAT family N-acetyltransferase [Actinokineospora sp. UTMC 2448]|uniref:GNAT family N-acetyltransferase n=1 Tax=Actinokineospora sp. UTMC 2448 TaxID=2268449 RepID=UPI002164CA65|nr:GNAT family N-acetyltransferase [Actinokineospora sp. UTMC 2448]UVS81079.1 putative N-acetyltransferase YjcF [Actinokineospora sp. UTMC 2448]